LDVSVCIRDVEEEALRLLRFMGVKNVDLRPYFVPHSWKEFHKKDMDSVSGIEEIKAKIVESSRVLKENGFNISTIDGPPIQWLFVKDNGTLDERIKSAVECYKDFIDILSELEIPVMLASISPRGFGPEDIPGRCGKVQPREYLMGAFDFQIFQEKIIENSKVGQSGIKKFEDLLTIHVKLLKEIASYAEKRNVKIAIHPDDPPIECENIPPGYTSLSKLQKLLNSVNSRNVGLVFCVGTLAQAGEDVYEALEFLTKRGKVFHVHLRNIKYNIPRHKRYEEVIIDEGEIDPVRILKILKSNNYEGTVNPDHVPIYRYDGLKYSTCWHLNDRRCIEGYLYTIGYIKGIIAAISSQ